MTVSIVIAVMVTSGLFMFLLDDCSSSGADKYEVCFYNEDELCYKEEIEIGEVITAPSGIPTPEKKNPEAGYDYYFTGWEGYTEGMVLTEMGMSFYAFYTAFKFDGGYYYVVTDSDVAFFPASEISNIKDVASIYNSLQLIVSVGTSYLVFDKASVLSLNDSDAFLRVSKLDNASLSEETRTLVGNRPVYDLSFGDNDDFGEGRVTVLFSYFLEEGEDPTDVVVYRISGGEELEKIECKCDDGSVVFDTNKFSMMYIGFGSDVKPFTTSPLVFLMVWFGIVTGIVLVVYFLVEKIKN